MTLLQQQPVTCKTDTHSEDLVTACWLRLQHM